MDHFHDREMLYLPLLLQRGQQTATLCFGESVAVPSHTNVWKHFPEEAWRGVTG